MRSAARILAATALALAGVGVPAAAWAAPTTEVVQGDVLRIVSVADWAAASSMTAEKPVHWDVTVSADAPDPGRIALAVSATGAAPLVLDVAMCPQAWSAEGCTGGARMLREAWLVPRDGEEVELARVADTDVAHVRLSVRVAEGAAGSTSIRFHAHGAGESAVVGPGGGLATTGMSPVVPWILAGGVALLVLGLVLLLSRRRRGNDRASDAEGDDAESGGAP